MKITALITTLTENHVPPEPHDWYWAVFGVIVYNFLLFSMKKDETDGTRKRMSMKKYADSRWDNWIASFLFVPIIVMFGEDIWYYLMAYFEKDWMFYHVLFLGSGALAQGVYYLLKKANVVFNALGKKH